MCILAFYLYFIYKFSGKKHSLEISAKADEELELSRLFSNSDAQSQGTTVELKRYMDRSYKISETQFSTLSFDGWVEDPVLFKGQHVGRLDAVVNLQCSAVDNIGAIKKSKPEKLLRANPNKMSKLWAKAAPQQVISRDRYISQDVKLCKAPAKISVELTNFIDFQGYVGDTPTHL